jgi:small-conductance mechanosensitive channel
MIVLIRYAIWAAGVVLAASALGLAGTHLTVMLGALSVGIGFGLQNIVNNFISGLILIFGRPFTVGDRIELWTAPLDTGTWGDVVEIGLWATKIRNPDNLVFVIPNSEVMRRDIVNYTASGGHIRLRIPIGIAYDADAVKAKAVIRDVALRVAGVMSVPEPQVIIRKFGESSVDLELRVWIADARRRRLVGDEITDRVKAAFDDAGIEIPYAKRDLYIRSMPPAEDWRVK